MILKSPSKLEPVTGAPAFAMNVMYETYCFSSYVFNIAGLPPLRFKGIVLFHSNSTVERSTPHCLATYF